MVDTVMIGNVPVAVNPKKEARGHLRIVPTYCRDNLQRSYTENLIRILLSTPAWQVYTMTGPAQLQAPEHARALARLELTEITAKIGQGSRCRR